MYFVVVLIFAVLSFCDIIIAKSKYDYTVDYERCVLYYQNPKLASMKKFNFLKYNRTTFALNVIGCTLADMGDEMELVLSVEKFAQNEYRPFPINFKLNLCDAWKKSTYQINQLRNYGNTTVCGVKKNECYYVSNYYPHFDLPPNLFFGRYKVIMSINYRKEITFIMHWYVHIHSVL